MAEAADQHHGLARYLRGAAAMPAHLWMIEKPPDVIGDPNQLGTLV